METMQSLQENNLNYDHIKKHGINQVDVENVNWTIVLLEGPRIWQKKIPIKGDIIQCSSPDDGMIRYPNGHLDEPIENEFASICVKPYGSPFVNHNGKEITSFSCSGGYWISEQELEMYEYIGRKKKMFCQWGSCGVAWSGAIYFQAEINVWKLIREDIY